MQRTVLALLLLATFLLGFVGGPHPCHEVEAAARQQLSGHPSCHKPAQPAGPSLAKGTRSAGPQDCCDIACQHACHMVAVLSVAPMASNVAPLFQRPVEKADWNVPAIAFPIDHIPLA